MSIEELIVRVTAWVEEYRWSGDPAALLDTTAQRDAAALWRVVRGVDPDTASAPLEALFLKACHALGLLHYWRHRASAGDRRHAELARALVCLEVVADDHHAVPAELHPLVGRFTDPDAQAEAAVALLAASVRLPDPALLDAVILLMTVAAQAPPPRDPRRGARLSHLCLALRRRHERDGAAADLDAAVTAGEEAVEIADGRGEPAPEAWSNLAAAYRCRHRLRGRAGDLRRAVDLLERRLAVTGADPAALAELGEAYRQRYEQTGDPAYVERAVALADQAVTRAGEQASPALLATLGGALLRRYERTGARPDLWRAADLSERIVAGLRPDVADRGAHLAAAASVLLKRYERSRSREDVHRAVDLYEQALSTLPDDDRARPPLLRGLAGALHQRHLTTGDGADLERAVTLAGWALAAVPPGHPERAAATMEAVAVHLTRYARTGVLADLAYAVDQAETVLAAGGPPPWLSTLGDAYQQRYVVTGDVADLDRAIALGERAAVGTDFALAARQVRLATAYWRRHRGADRKSDLDRAVELGERAVSGTPADHVELPGRLSLLAEMRLDRYRIGGTTADADAAADLGERALASAPADHPGRSLFTATVCVAHLERGAAALDPARLRDLAAGVAEARGTAPLDRIAAHHAAGSLALAAGDATLAVQLLDRAVALLPSAAPREAGWADQQHRLGRQAGLVGDAVAAHCAAGDPRGAVEVAELGRGVLLASQANTRVDLVELADRDPRLADRFGWVCDRLNTPDFPADERRRWWADYDALLIEIRQLPGLEEFLAAPRLAGLRPAVAGGCAVLVNASRHRGDAVVVRPDAEPSLVELPALRLSDVDTWVTALLGAFEGEPSLAGVLRRGRVVREVLDWLEETVVGPVVATLPATEAAPCRVWWLPTGLLGLLPLHAAGTAPDLLVSSYIPSLRALRTARDRPPTTRRRRLTVALPHTPGLAALPGAAREAAALGGTVLTDGQATADRVVPAIEAATWAHFACHGVLDPTSQADSGLRLFDRTLRLPEVGGLRLAEAELAYLSACSTANHGIRYADEVLHLASAFQFAGFRHVVACLWPLDDGIARKAARAFYKGLPDAPVADGAATVLRQVIRRLRAANPDRPDLWAPLIHSGP
ncbi:CHAT domain-containing protein [Dactylosporangium aurantiacum]|uniref:CHAT domain-containing protein n=1 Tax=Dactylosporangium aurantiacum TaxID=35754 RepID=A0A9Q9MRI2_9ACTN|nr:CHAT domain-containing protein [Dactylosporangium aurantiacum]MDG6108283.1 CHAT domain-containing protein [Dactylosporangium aurantiacum]UWZ58527.1 CHAT domain-containing protein [Dactylosporangium aurantiacum]